MKPIPHKFQSAARITCYCIFLASLPQSPVAQIIQRKGVSWVAPATKILRLNGYEVKEVTELNGIRRAYIRRGIDNEWIPFYARERFLLVTLGNRRRLVLINDCPATKFCKVIVADLTSGKVRQIDLQAVEIYRRNASPDKRLVIVPQAYAFSPDDRQALINMELIYIRVPGDEKEVAERVNKSYKHWWYVVDSASGSVLREYRASKIPKRWWTSNRRQRV